MMKAFKWSLVHVLLLPAIVSVVGQDELDLDIVSDNQRNPRIVDGKTSKSFRSKNASKNDSDSKRSLATTAQEMASLQTWLDNQVNTKNPLVGVSAFVVAGDEPFQTVTSGKAVLASAWDVTTKKGISTTAKDVTADTACMMASVSKTFTWTALTMLLDAGKFGLDDPIDDILSFNIRNPRFPNVPVTYRHLYAHTSGIKDNYDTYGYGDQCPTDEMYPYSYTESLEQSIRGITDNQSGWSIQRPGSTYRYSNYGSTVAAMLVEKHSGLSFPAFAKKYIFEPLQMTSTQFVRPSDGSAAELYTLYNRNGYKYKTNFGGYCYPDYPSGQLWSTSGDLAKFAIAMLKRGNLGYTTSDGANCLYSEETGALAFEKSSSSTGDGDSALGWFVGDPYYTGGAGHDGSETGVSSDFFVHLQNNVAIGYWANGELTDNLYDLLYTRLLQTANAIGGIENSYNSNSPQPCTTVLSTSSPSPPTPPTPTTSPNSPTPPSPTPPTSSQPTSGPSMGHDCLDSPLRFKVFINGRGRFKDCNWVKRDTSRCFKNANKVAATCPLTCGTCSKCTDSPLTFKVEFKNGSRRNKKCWWANNWRCSNIDNLAETCRKKCGLCQA